MNLTTDLKWFIFDIEREKDVNWGGEPKTDLKGYILLKSHISLILNANKIYNELFKIFDIERE